MTPQSKKAVPRLESLEDRAVPAVTTQLVGTTLYITGDARNDTVNLYEYAMLPGYYGTSHLIVSWKDDLGKSGGGNFLLPALSKIVFNGNGGNDKLLNVTNPDGQAMVVNPYVGIQPPQLRPMFTVVPSMMPKVEAYGGDGNDTLRPGSCRGSTLIGGNGIDVLYGGAGNDLLYGDAGYDYLYGNAGNDGLFGGDVANYLNGGAGADRYLTRPGDTIAAGELTADDARINFVNSAGRTITSNGVAYTYAPGTWADAEIKKIDLALMVLHQRTNNTKLLKQYTGASMTYERLGWTNYPYTGWNLSNGTILLTANSLVSQAEITATVWHEMGHNWQYSSPQAAGASWSNFLLLSGWQQGSTPNANQLLSGDKHWVYSKSLQYSGFARAYGRTNPYEDWATVWELACNSTFATSDTVLQAKINLVRNFFNALKT
jgi:Ca2+-binding RTX toxin-like protein